LLAIALAYSLLPTHYFKGAGFGNFAEAYREGLSVATVPVSAVRKRRRFSPVTRI